MSDLITIRRALISVSDKTGVVEFANALVREFGVELVSTGGTAKALRDAGLTVIDVADVTGFPETMDGRLKTLHPLIHGGLLARRDDELHVAAMAEHNITPIDLLCVNLYPFEQTIAHPGCSFDDAIENIDIGGPAMIRAAAKNHRFVLVVTSPDRYGKVLGDLREHGGACCGKHRLKQARRAFAHTSAYDAAIAAYLGGAVDDPAALPESLSLNLSRKQVLRYGENPHQRAALYTNAPSALAAAKQLHGKDLSYTNLLDADAALACVGEFDEPAVCVVKHATPCGAAIAANLADAFENAYACDPLAAFGGIVAVNRPVDLATAQRIVAGEKFLEVIVAPAFDGDALELLRSRWKNVRLLAIDAQTPPPGTPGGGAGEGRGTHARHQTHASTAALPLTPSQSTGRGSLNIRSVAGGFLVQDRDASASNEADWKVVTRREPTAQELTDLRFAWRVVKHVKSNAIVIARNGATVGIGGGAVDRVGAAKIAVAKAGEAASGAVAASDAFFPFADGPNLLFAAGVRAIIQPGGSVRDAETIAAADVAAAAMIFTGRRHFRH